MQKSSAVATVNASHSGCVISHLSYLWCACGGVNNRSAVRCGRACVGARLRNSIQTASAWVTVWCTVLTHTVRAIFGLHASTASHLQDYTSLLLLLQLEVTRGAFLSDCNCMPLHLPLTAVDVVPASQAVLSQPTAVPALLRLHVGPPTAESVTAAGVCHG